MGAACLVVSRRCPQEDTWQRPLRWPVCSTMQEMQTWLGDGYGEMKRSLNTAVARLVRGLEDTHGTQAASASLHCLESLGFLGLSVNTSIEETGACPGLLLDSDSSWESCCDSTLQLVCGPISSRCISADLCHGHSFQVLHIQHLTEDCGPPA